MIGGFIIEDGARQVLIQAKGPELVNDGISNVLADPVLTVIQTSEGEAPRTVLDPPIELMVNDNWEDSQGQLISDLWGGSPPLTAGGLSAAVVLTLGPGEYTAKVEGKNGTAGVALVEVYGTGSLLSPNLIFIMADDLGWADVGYNGASFYETPHIDALCASGMKFNSAYPGASNCMPSRACIVSGMYTPRTQMWTPGGKAKGEAAYMKFLVPRREDDSGDGIFPSKTSMDPSVTSIAEVLKSAGYMTARFGKWHLGPDTQGFDLSDPNGLGGPEVNYYNDIGVGRIREAVQAQGLAGKTLIVFTSDNGGFSGATWNEPLKGAKGAFFEGGIRVATCMSWPGVIKAGSVCETPITGVDYLPTFAQLAGANLPTHQPVDGQSLVPLILGKSALENRSIFWHYPLYLEGAQYNTVVNVYDTDIPYWRATPCSVIRQGDWKLMQFFEDDSVKLFNLKEDLGEIRDLAHSQPEKAAMLLEELRAWQKRTGAVIPSVLNPG